MWANPKKIHICGMRRSGSTLLYNIVHGLRRYHTKGWRIRKMHQTWMNRFRRRPKINDKSIYSYRDVRDVAASYCYKYNMNFDNFQVEGKCIMEFLEWIIEYDKFIKCRNWKNILYLKYEDSIIGDIVSTYNKISDFLGVSNDYNTELRNELCIDKQKAFTDNLTSLDKKTNFWPNHIKDGKQNKYRDVFTDEQIELINNNKSVSVYLRANGYESGE